MYSHVDVFSLLNNHTVTDLMGQSNYDSATGAIASSKGVLNTGIVPAEYCSFLDSNVNSELAKFCSHNGGAQDQYLLNEMWESLALVPLHTCPRMVITTSGARGSIPCSASAIMTLSLRMVSHSIFWCLLTANFFLGHLNFGKFSYKDASGYILDTQALVFKVKF